MAVVLFWQIGGSQEICPITLLLIILTTYTRICYVACAPRLDIVAHNGSPCGPDEVTRMRNDQCSSMALSLETEQVKECVKRVLVPDGNV